MKINDLRQGLLRLASTLASGGGDDWVASDRETEVVDEALASVAAWIQDHRCGLCGRLCGADEGPVQAWRDGAQVELRVCETCRENENASRCDQCGTVWDTCDLENLADRHSGEVEDFYACPHCEDVADDAIVAVLAEVVDQHAAIVQFARENVAKGVGR